MAEAQTLAELAGDQHPKKVDVVCDGGGIWGIALVGALSALEKHGYQVQNLAGTSAGAIVAALAAAGYTGAEIRDIMLHEKFGEFADKTWEAALPLVGLPLSILVEAGICRGDVLLNLLRTLLRARGVRTFRDLLHPQYADQPRYRYKLQLIASDITARRMLVLPRDAATLGIEPDDLEVALALRMSMSVPIFFEPVRIFNPHTKQEHLITDGAMLSNFPVWLFDSDGKPEWPTFGLKLVAGNPKSPRSLSRPPMPAHGVGMVIDLLSGLVQTMMDAHDSMYLESDTFVRTITIPTLGISGTDFNLTAGQLTSLYDSGHAATEAFLKTWNFTDYVARYRSNQQLPSRREAAVDAPRVPHLA